MAEISAIPQQPQLGRLAQFLRYLETEKPEFLPSQLDVMGLVRQLTLPQAATVENLSYGNLPFTMPPSGTGAMIPQVKTGRKPEVADLVGMLGGVPGMGAVADVGTKLSNEAADAIVRAITRNPAATAPQVIQETAMPVMQAVAPKMPSLLETPAKSELGFYSALEQATMPLQNKGTGSQFLAQIEKTAGVKPEEVKWTGLDEFLKSRQNVTKQEVQDYLAANRVDLQEVRLGQPESINKNSKYATPEVLRIVSQNQGSANNAALLALDNDYAAYKEITTKFPELRNDPDWAETVLKDVTGTTENLQNLPKFSQYTIPGGENYREILLTLPQKQISIAAPDTSKWSVVTKETSPTSGARQIQVRDEQGNMIGQRFGFQGTDQDAIQELIPGYMARQQQISANQTNFRSSHFDQPNILAHMRVNDRVVDGKNTLFIEEIQSDWHQAGRKKGYQQPPNEARVVEINQRLRELAKSDMENTPEWETLTREKQSLQDRTGVPDAPFKTTWHELTLKRAIQEASEKGYDQIAFTTGKTQAERYDLSKQVDSLLYSKNPDGTYRVSAQVQGRGQMMGEAIPEANLADYVGKEVAEKISKGIGKQTEVQGKPIPGQWGTPKEYMTELSGEGLKVGGEGMKGFYDQILPKTLDKLGKKFDAKVTKTRLDVRGEDKLAIKLRENGYDPYNADLQQILTDNGGRQPRWLNDTDMTALELGYTPSLKDAGVEVWAMDITPKMRESVLTKGQPLFQFAPAAPAAGLLGGDESE